VLIQGISNMDKRSDWPLSVQCRALEELIKETPGDLLAKYVTPVSGLGCDTDTAGTLSRCCDVCLQGVVVLKYEC
jgi:hypothetical protein